jgi:thiol-disulfide isomerase/thioredoxin
LDDNLSLHELHYKKFSIDRKSRDKIVHFQGCKILVLTEPWCGDSLALLPIIKKISEENGQWEIRVLLRDSNLKIMDQFLTRGVRGIPMFLFLDEKGDLLFNWGPRPVGAVQIFDKYREQIKQGELEKQEVINKIRIYYAKDRGVNTLVELMTVFEAHDL